MCDNCHGALISTPGPLCHPRACLTASFLHTAPPCSPHVPMPPHSHTYTCPPPLLQHTHTLLTDSTTASTTSSLKGLKARQEKVMQKVARPLPS